MIRECTPDDFNDVWTVIDDAAVAYQGIIAADTWTIPYMSKGELRQETAQGVVFFGFFEVDRLLAVMGLQAVEDVSLIRHAYTRTVSQGRGIGAALLAHLQRQTDRPLLVGTWEAASWAIRFYQSRGFRLVTPEQKDALLRTYWGVPERQIEESVVLADARWFAQSPQPDP
jgi:GNAT superfamily N-acetyltransferase